MKRYYLTSSLALDDFARRIVRVVGGFEEATEISFFVVHGDGLWRGC